MSALPDATMSSACFGSVIRPTAMVVSAGRFLHALRQRHLVAGPERDLLQRRDAAGGDVDPVDATFLQFLAKIRWFAPGPSRPRPSRSPRRGCRPACCPGTRHARRRTPRADSACGSRASRHIVGALVGDRRQELMQQIAVRAVQFERIDAEPLGTFGGIHERVADAREAGSVERGRRGLALLVRHRRRRHRLPAAWLAERDLLPAVPWPRARALAASMGELHRDGGFRMLAHRSEDRLQRGLVGVAVKPEAARRDAADRLDMRRLDAEHRGAGQREIVDVGEMPVIGRAVLGRILAHRRDHDAVGESQAAQLDRGKQALILGFPGDRGREEGSGTLEAAAHSTKRQATGMAMRRRRSWRSERATAHAHWSSKASNLPGLRSITL